MKSAHAHRVVCVNFVDFATQRNGRRGREKDLLVEHQEFFLN
jgi:hypothetical protein